MDEESLHRRSSYPGAQLVDRPTHAPEGDSEYEGLDVRIRLGLVWCRLGQHVPHWYLEAASVRT